jgi:hypothetical protein
MAFETVNIFSSSVSALKNHLFNRESVKIPSRSNDFDLCM